MKIEPCITIANTLYPVLRIFASWPADAKLNRTEGTQDLKKSKVREVTKTRAEVDEDNVDVIDPDPHPLAALHLDNFNNINNMLAKSWYMNDTEQMAVVFVKDQYNDKDQV
jgi:hypothetical protein